jgi:hypothetical protein
MDRGPHTSGRWASLSFSPNGAAKTRATPSSLCCLLLHARPETVELNDLRVQGGVGTLRLHRSLGWLPSPPAHAYMSQSACARAVRQTPLPPPYSFPDHRATHDRIGVQGVSPDTTEAAHRIAGREGPLDLRNCSTEAATVAKPRRRLSTPINHR